MELTMLKVYQLNANQIFEVLLPTINKFYEKIEYTGITKEDFYNLVLVEINKSKRFYKGDIDYTKYIKGRINVAIFEQIKKILSNQETAIILINNYINKYFKKSDTYESSINNLEKLSKLFDSYDYIPSPDILLQIIKENEILYNAIESIMKKYQNQIISGNIDQIIDNSTIILIIEAYCMLNNIEIKESEDYEKNIIDLEYYDLTDSVKTYLKEASRRPLLSIEEEQKLLKRISQGDNYAREVFIESNLKLVISIARKYVNRGLPFLDLIQEGNIGLLTAVDRFDINKKTRFSTYATWWIRQSITRAIADKGRNVRIPVHLHEKIVTYQKAVINLESKLNRKPALNEIANEMKLSISEVIELQKLQNDTVSINTLVGEDESTELEDFIPANEDTLDDIATTNIMQHQVRKLLEDCNLKPREIEVLMLRFGFSGKRPMKLEEIGKKFDITRERVRQIESSALMKIRKSRYIKSLSDYMPNPDTAIKNIDFFREEYSKSGNVHKNLIKEVNNQQQDDKDTKKESKPTVRKSKTPKLKTIYEYFNTYTKEQVDEMLEKLTEEERALITLKYGEDLNNPITSSAFGKKDRRKFFNTLAPKMKRLLTNTDRKEGDNNMSKLKTIYEYFNTYTKDQVDEMLEKLTEEERALITLRYGEDLNNPVLGKLSKDENYKFYQLLVPKMKRLLANPNKTRKILTIYEYFNTYTKDQVDEMLGKLAEEERALITLKYGEDLNNPITSPAFGKKDSRKFFNTLVPKMKRLLARLNKETKAEKNSKVEESQSIVAEIPIIPVEEPTTETNATSEDKSNNITKEDYIRMLELLRTPSFNQMLGTLTVKESVIISLRLGYIDGKYFSTESIAEFLGIETQEVIETTKKVLLLYKENINQYIDNAIRITTNEPNQLTRKK